MARLLNLHTLAAARGDGLRQEFLELLTSRQSQDAPNVEDISAHLAEHFVQAGPNPVPDRRITAEDGVLIFTRLRSATADATIPPAKQQAN